MASLIEAKSRGAGDHLGSLLATPCCGASRAGSERPWEKSRVGHRWEVRGPAMGRKGMDFCKSTVWLGAWVATAAIFIAACTRDTEPPKETPADFVARASERLNKSARSAELAGFDFRADGSP